MKKSKKNYIIIFLIVILLALGIGYAAFSSTLTITGTVTSNSNWDIKFTSATWYSDGEGTVDTTHDATAIVTDEEITASVTLNYPGDAVLLEAVVINNGNIPAKLTELNVTGGDDDFKITQASVTTNEELDVGDTCKIQYLVQWDAESEAETLGTKTFTITYNYSQNTENITIVPQHNHSNN